MDWAGVPLVELRVLVVEWGVSVVPSGVLVMDDNLIMTHAVLSRTVYRRWGKYSIANHTVVSWAWPARWSGSHLQQRTGRVPALHYFSTFGGTECSVRLI